MKPKVALLLAALVVGILAFVYLFNGIEQKPIVDIPSQTIWQLEFEGEGTPNFDKVYDVELDTQGQSLLFWADDTVKDIDFTAVEYHETKGFIDADTLYTFKELQSGEAIRLRYYLPETIPNLKISFTLKDSSRFDFLIAQSGKDGSILLIDPSEAATPAKG